MILKSFIKSFFEHNPNFYALSGEKIPHYEIVSYYNSLRNYLHKSYFPNDTVALYLEKDYKYVISIFVCFELGITVIPLNKKWPLLRTQEILNLSTPTLLLCDQLCSLHNNSVNICDLDDNKPLIINQNLDKNSIAYIIFTSGSTGSPKGVMIKRDSFANFITWTNNYFTHINHHDVLLNTADFTFDLSFLDLALLLSKNLHFYISTFNGNVFSLLGEIQDYNVTIVSTVPNNFQMIFTQGVYEKANLATLQNYLIGGARLSYGLYLKLKKNLSCNIYNLYGPTEATVYCTVKKINFVDDLAAEAVSVGKAILNCKIKIVDDTFENLPHHTNGKVLIGGVQVMHKYLNNEEKTNSALITLENEIYYDTGDIGFVNSNNDLFIVGRYDDTIKTEGYRVNLSDIDSLIQTLTYIEESSTIALPDEVKENILISYVKCSKNITTEIIFDDLTKKMPNYQVPKKIIYIDKFPLNSSGKICKKSLLNLYKVSS